jgi:hypothetical protein
MRPLLRPITISVIAALAVGLGAARGQDQGGTPQGRPVAKAKQVAASAAQGTAGQPAAEPAGASSVLDEVRRDEEVSATGVGLTYDPAGRRDPFVSPTEAEQLLAAGPCEGEGSECWLIAEIGLVGIMGRRSGGVALVIGPEGYGASLKAGDKLYDGEVLSVDGVSGNVIFRQKVSDPTRIKPYRDVEKKLSTSREGGI